MLARQDVLTTLRMVQEENLDVRTVTLGINLNVCASRDPSALVDAVRARIVTQARDLVPCCDEVAARYGLPIVNKRVAVSPASILLEGHTPETAVRLAQALTIPVIASGGLSGIADIEALCNVENEGVEGVICGRAIYSGALDFEAAQTLADALNG